MSDRPCGTYEFKIDNLNNNNMNEENCGCHKQQFDLKVSLVQLVFML